MPDYINRSDFMALLKKVSYLEDYIKNSMKERRKSLWVGEAEAMEMIGCGKTKLKDLRDKGIVRSKHNGSKRNYQFYRESVEAYMVDNSTLKIV